MFPFVETIKIVDGRAKHLAFHQARLDRTFLVNFRKNSPFLLTNVLTIPKIFCRGMVKLRFLYDENSFQTEFDFYQPRVIMSLKIVFADEIDYRFKSTNRKKIDELLERRGDCDDILIVKNGFITDSSIANVVFSDGQKLVTPDTSLLAGTHRARLLAQGIVEKTSILIDDIKRFSHFGLINAMTEDEIEMLPVENIRW